jgi:chromate transport protein ChrA
VLASFRGIQPAAAALILRGVHRLSEHALSDEHTHELSPLLFLQFALAALQSVMRVNFFATLVFCGVLHFLLVRASHQKEQRHATYALAALWTALGCIAYGLFAGRIGAAARRAGA